MKNKIVSLTTDGITFELGKAAPADEVSGRIVNHIEYKRDGVYGITKHTNETGSYSIILMHPVTEKDFVTMVVPYSKMDRILVVKVEEDSDKPSEIAEKMQKVG